MHLLTRCPVASVKCPNHSAKCPKQKSHNTTLDGAAHPGGLLLAALPHPELPTESAFASSVAIGCSS
eukprot:621511-Lingulodinium_polyedra.AAC.1